MDGEIGHELILADTEQWLYEVYCIILSTFIYV